MKKIDIFTPDEDRKLEIKISKMTSFNSINLPKKIVVDQENKILE
jgi:hypothetical protein